MFALAAWSALCLLTRMPDFVIPKHEPEVLRANADRGGSDASTTMFAALMYLEVRMESTGRLVRDYEVMGRIIRALEPEQRDVINHITCYSQDGYRFEVRVMSRDSGVAAQVLSVVHTTCLQALGGHGGIEVISYGANRTRARPQWGETM